MRDDISCLEPENIEANSSLLLKSKFSDTTLANLREFINGIWQGFLKRLLADPQELQVYQKVDRHGNKFWQAYDPMTGKSFSSGSEADVSMWIEQLYQQQRYDTINSGNWQ